MEFINDIKNNLKSVLQTTDKIKWIDIEKIIIDPEMEGIFVQKETEIQNIANNMIENQKNHKSPFDPAHPIILAYSKEHPELNNINADGHTRYKAALRVGLTKVAIIYKEFADRADLLKFVYKQQLLRRNLSEQEVFKSWEALNRLTNEDGKKVKSDSAIAEELQISRRQVCKMKEVEKKATPEVLESIKSGELTVNKAYTQIKQEEAKTEDSVPSVAKSVEKYKDVPKSKTTKSTNTEYLKAYAEGWMYVFESLRCGKSPKELQTELAELKAGTKSVESLQETLLTLKESYEQKQAE